ncbi:MAG: glycosyltransferase family 4 protein [Bryobacterales bacterium]|nr:glycosyltransferase family 4 protein [Bryobacterales bacterium]
MRVIIDATSLLLRSAGVKSHIYHWLTAMRQIAGYDAVRAFPFIGKTGALDHERSMFPLWATYPRLAVLYGVNLAGSAALDWFMQGADVFHASNQVHHAPRNAKLTATVFDLTTAKMPEVHTAANVKADQWYAEQILKRADGLMAISESTRHDAIEILGIPEDKIETIHLGVPDAYFRVPVADVLHVKEFYGLTKPYVLSLGTIEPRKNIDRLMDAWLDLPPHLREQYELLIAGPAGWASANTLRRITAGAQGVRHLGYVPEEALPGLTAGALVLAYPSLYEGFGLPLAQAMAAGVAAVTSNVSSLPEVAGEGAELVDPLSVSEIKSALMRLLENDTLRERRAAQGRDKAQNYRWQRNARRSLDFFERVAGR